MEKEHDKVRKQFFMTGYIGEGAKRMLLDLSGMDNVELIDRVIDSRVIRFLYYRCSEMTGRFLRCGFLKRMFYPWFNVFHIHCKENAENYLIFFNSGFCRELDAIVVRRLKKKYKDLRLVLYIVDPVAGFNVLEHREVIEQMDIVYSVNEADCRKYGFQYHPLVYSREPDPDINECTESFGGREPVLYYLGSGIDRTGMLADIHKRCMEEGIRTDFHVVDGRSDHLEEGITFHKEAVSYAENVRMLKRSDCLLEIMHEHFDNPTQRYSEAVVYNKRMITNNKKISGFEFFDPRYMQVFETAEGLDTEFIKKKENVNYGYKEEFSPRYLIQRIASLQEG